MKIVVVFVVSATKDAMGDGDENLARLWHGPFPIGLLTEGPDEPCQGWFRKGIDFINVAALTRHHVIQTSVPMSRLLTFTDGTQDVRVQCYLHSSEFAPQGWYGRAERVIRLHRPFRLPARTG